MNNFEGQTFAGYEIICELGRGGMGAVYKARQPMLNRLVALKMMAPNLSGDPSFVARFIREASAAANLNHPNMVQVYTAGENDKIYYIAMEFVEGESLRIRLDRMGRIPPQEAVAITVYVAQALQYAWNKAHLIHRDIKPDNIFLSNSGEVKVGDLGLAKSVGGETTDMTQTGMVMGSPHYISPEQAQGAKDIDFHADIYSLGCTLYHMLTGKTPYQGDSSMAIMMKHINEPAPAIFRTWPACPMPLGRLVGKMVAKRRQERHQSYEDLVADLMQVHEKLRQTESVAPVATTPAPAVSGAAVSDTAPKAKKTDAGAGTQAKVGNRMPIYAAAGACAAVVLAGLLWWSPWKSGEEAKDKGQAEAGSESRLQTESVPTQPAKPGTSTAAPAELPRQETVAPITSPMPAPPPAAVVQPAPAADSAPATSQPAIPTATAPFDAAQARQHQEAWAKHLGVPVEMTNSIGMKFVLIPPGEFDMGSSAEAVAFELEEGRRTKPPVHKFYVDRVLTEKPQRRVKVTKPFYLGTCEVTQGEYQAVTDGNPSAFSAAGSRKNVSQIAGADTSRHPVEMVSWDEAKQFLGQMSNLPAESSSRRSYRLPTEAEWEHACRAGTTTRWWHGNDVASLPPCAWFKENSGGATHPVGQTRPNPWGLFDMPGNVFEWCSDRCNESAYEPSETTDPQGPADGHFHITRGGCYERYALSTRSAYRGVAGGSPWPVRSDFMGFRVLCEVAARSQITRAAPDSQTPVTAAPVPAAPAAAAPAQTDAGFQPLFNGRDLSGWVPMKSSGRDDTEHQPTTGGWNVQDGELVCATDQTGWLKTERQYGDYVLQLEFKLRRDSNSDVYIRCPTSGHIARVAMAIQILDPNYKGKQLPPDKLTGAIYGVVGSPQPPVRPPAEWNSMEIRCEGDSVEVTLNGTRTASANMSQVPALQNRPRSGYIGIGNWHGEANGMAFRNIRIKELGAPSGQNTINLLPLIDPQKDAVQGDWKLTTDGLVLEKPKLAGVLDLPYAPPEEYDFEIEFTPTSDGKNVNQYLAAAGRSFAWKLNMYDQKPPIHGLDLLDGKVAKTRGEAVVQKSLTLESGQRYTSKVEVRRGSLRARVNGEEFLQWSGDFNRLSMESYFKLHDDRHLGVGSVMRGVVFHRIEVREVTGKGTFARGAPVSQVSTQATKSTLVLFDGKDCSAWEGVRGQVCPWRILEDGSMETVPKSGDITTRQKFRDFQMHVEFWLPLLPPDVKDQKRANSGIFLQGLYEIQVLDSYNNPTYPMGGCCAIYKIKEPDNADKALKPPETWNAYDITFRAARFDAAGNKTANARVTVLWNGVKAHDNAELPTPTVGNRGKENIPGSIRLQDHGNKIRYRKIWIMPSEEGVPVKEAVSTPTAVNDLFIKEIAALPAEQQVARVVAKLKELNAGFDGKETHKVESGTVTELAISTMGVTNISPVSALKQLKKLTVAPWAMNQKGSLADLSALKELPLSWLYCQNNPINDLSPLKNMPLTVLSCGGTQVSDLSPLAGMKLTVLSINGTSVSDLSPLSGMPLTVLWCNSTWVADFASLKGLPLQELRCDFQPQRDTDALRGIPTLRKINDQPAAVLLRQPATSTQAPRTSALGGDIRVLIVTGVDSPAHDWRSTGPAIRNELQKDPRMKVEILNDIYRLDSMDLTKFQVVLLNFYTKGKPDPNEQAKDNLKNFVNRGGGLVIFHSTCGSFRDWPEFRDLAGKIMSHEKPAMDMVGPMRVKIVNQNHPITRGMQPYETTDELYAFLTGRKPVEVLATAHAKCTGSDEPMAFVLTYGKGRVFHIVLGHTVGAIETPGTAELLRRGTSWVAGREPVPSTATQRPLR